jgi:hypothetical protein
MELSKGNIVNTTAGRGVVVDRMSYAGEVLVRLYRGTAIDREHGQWFDECDVVRVGHDASAMVWRPLSRSGMGPAGPDFIKRYADQYAEFCATERVPEWKLNERRSTTGTRRGWTVPDRLYRNDLQGLHVALIRSAARGHIGYWSGAVGRLLPANHADCNTADCRVVAERLSH